MADVKGDVAALAGSPNERIQQRVAQIGIEGYKQEASPVVFWDLLGRFDGRGPPTLVCPGGAGELGRRVR
jgi:hypothetical protein